jgi:histidine triad (HIT) family protein
MTAYEPSNIFARILRGELPAHKIYEDEHTLALMDVMPIGEGHCLVIPKAPSRNLLDADAATLGALMQTVQKVARAAKAAFQAEGVMIQQFNETASGQTVFHLHVHVIPRRQGSPLGSHGSRMADPETLAAHAARIRDALEAVQNPR